jgi:hypothetical protein
MNINSLIAAIQPQLETLTYLLLAINGLLHLIFAGAVAKDAGITAKRGAPLALVSAPTWAFATLIGGIVTASLYWFIHHSTLTRPQGVSYES